MKRECEQGGGLCLRHDILQEQMKWALTSKVCRRGCSSLLLVEESIYRGQNVSKDAENEEICRRNQVQQDVPEQTARY